MAKEQRYDPEFLPEAESLIETPASPFSRWFAFAVLALFTALVVWAWFAKVDTVIVAQGRLVSEDRAQLVQAERGGTVSRILVRNGQQVGKGDAVLHLDSTQSLAEQASLSERLQNTRAELVLIESLLSGIEPTADLLDQGSSDYLRTTLTERFVERFNQNRDTLLGFDAQLSQKAKLIDASRSAMEASESLLPMLTDRLERGQRLFRQQLISVLELGELEIAVERENNSVSQLRKQISAAESEIDEIENRRLAYIAQNRSELLEQFDDLKNRTIELEQNLLILDRSVSLRLVRSPISGTVQELTAYTEGGVVQAGEVLMKVAPTKFDLEGEALMLNKDRGFVQEGMPIKIKLVAFPFTKYGFLEGTLVSISDDAIDHPDFGPVFSLGVSFDETTIRVEGNDIALQPGLLAEFEVQSAEKRVLEFLISPLLRYRDEALRER